MCHGNQNFLCLINIDAISGVGVNLLGIGYLKNVSGSTYQNIDTHPKLWHCGLFCQNDLCLSLGNYKTWITDERTVSISLK